jgi:hypothetical protein
MHHAVVNEMPTAAAPENAIAESKTCRVCGGLEVNLNIRWVDECGRLQITSQIFRTPVFDDEGKDGEDRNRAGFD